MIESIKNGNNEIKSIIFICFLKKLKYESPKLFQTVNLTINSIKNTENTRYSKLDEI